MKTSAVASLLFGTLAIAAPLEKRRYVTSTSVVIQTEIIYVTVWDGQAPVAQATSTPGLFYEQPPKQSPKASSTSAAAPTTSSTKEKEPENAYTPPPPAPKTSSTAAPPAPEPTSIYTPPAPAPEPSSSSAYVAPAPAPSSSNPAPAEPSAPSGGGDEQKGEITVYDTYNGYGACGTLLSDDEFTAAISKDSWGADIWGGADNLNQNPWCGKSATVTYNGKSVTVKIMDKCQGCVPGDIDLTRAAWNKLTDNAYGSRFQGSWTTS